MALSEILLYLIALQATGTLPVPASPEFVTDVTDCRQIVDRDERLNCFDRTTEVLQDATDADEVVVVERSQIEETKRERFGLSLPDLGIFSRSDESQISEISSTLERARETSWARWQLTLADGSIWNSAEADRNFRPRRGDQVVIKSAALGSFMASVGDEDVIRVRRAQ